MQQQGFSLTELLVAMTVALVLASMMFHLFHQNERVIRDQTLIMEMQQTARIVASQIADEVRMAGQGVPIYAAGFDPAPSEAAAVFLGSSTSNRIDFRSGLSNVETSSPAIGASDFSIGVSKPLLVATSAGFLAGKTAYLSGPGAGQMWSWLRADIVSVSSTTLILTPRDTGALVTTIHFAAAPTASLEEGVSIFLNAGSVRRATASNLSDPLNPKWSPANEIGQHFTDLSFTYYDGFGNAVQPSTLQNRATIARVNVQLTVEVASPLSNGTRPRYSLAFQTIPRNVLLRTAPM